MTAPPPVKVEPRALPDYPVEVDPAILRGHVLALTGTSAPRNAANVAALNEAAKYIADQLASMGYGVYEQRYTADGQTYKNVIAHYGNRDKPRVVIGAHYDVAGNQAGADDNASSVAGLLELARLIGAHHPVLPYDLDLVAFTLEEPPHFGKPTMGSAVHANALRVEGVNVRAMIGLEMIGYFSDQPGSQEIPPLVTRAPLPKTGNFIAVVGRSGDHDPVSAVAQGMRYGCDIGVQPITASRLLGVGLSDHQNYWDAGFPAVMVTDTSFYRNPNYHKATDTPDTLDYNRMAEVVEGLYYALFVL